MNGYEIASLFKAISSKDVSAVNHPLSIHSILKIVNTFRNEKLRQIGISTRQVYNSCQQSFDVRRSHYVEDGNVAGVFIVPDVFYDAFGVPLVYVFYCGCKLKCVSDKHEFLRYNGTKYSHLIDGAYYYDAANNAIVVNNSTIDIIEVNGIFEDPMSVPGFSLYDEYPCPVEYIAMMREWAARYKKPITQIDIGKLDPIAS